jgi:hypothetical protein
MDVMYGPLGSVNQGFQANLGQNAAAMGQQQNFYGDLAAAGANNQAVTDNLYGPEGFGGATARNAYLGAEAGRATGGFGGEPGRIGTIGNPGTSNPGYYDFGGGADQKWVTGGSQGQRPSVWTQGAPAFEYGGTADIDWMKAGSQGDRPSSLYGPPGGGAWDTADQFNRPYAPPAASQPAPSLNSRFGGGGGGDTYNQFGQNYAPSRLGGAEDQAWVQGGSQGARPSTGLTYGGNEDVQWMLGGSQGERPSISEAFADRYGTLPDALGSNPLYSSSGLPSLITGGRELRPAQELPQRPFDYGVSPYNNYGLPSLGGSEDQAWVRGGSQGARPSSGLTYGGNEDMQWMLGGSQGERPSIMASSGPPQLSPLQMYDPATSFGTRGGSAYADRYGQYAGERELSEITSSSDLGRNAIAEQVMRQNKGDLNTSPSRMPSAVFGGYRAEDMWRDPFAQPGSGNLGATGIYQDPFGGFYSADEVARNGVWGPPHPDYQQQGLYQDDPMPWLGNFFGNQSPGGG